MYKAGLHLVSLYLNLNGMPQTSPLLVAQLTDTHLFANENQEMMGCRTFDTFQAVIKQIGQLHPKPDVLLLTGDLSQDETSESYQHLRDWTALLEIPAYWLPGNHDQEPVAMEKILCSDLIFLDKCFQAGGWNFVLLNSMLVGQVQGELSPETLVVLEQQLQQFAVQPTLIALHHPPLPIGSEWMDRIGLQNSQALFEVVDRHPQVKLVIFGHIHQEFDQWRNGVRYLGTPSTCVQFRPQRDRLEIDAQGSGFRLVSLYPDGSHSTSVERV